VAAPAGQVAPAADRPRPGPPVALYVHVPFCRSLCPYCDFVVYAGSAAVGPRSQVAAFLLALRRELDLRADLFDAAFGAPGSPARPPLASLYLGGGTPSLLPAEAVEELVAAVRERFGLAPGAEVTLEANPGSDDRGDLAGFARAGVNRLSLGAQSLDDGELRRLGRRHRAADVGEAVAAARAAGIAAVSLDLLYDVPGQRLATWAATVEAALDLEPDHLSCYALTLDDPDAEGLTGPLGDHLPTTPGARRWRERAERGQDEDRAAAAYALADAALEGAGMPWYELSNWARPGAESRHNLAYWERRPYEALGPGAHAFDGVQRRWNAARLDAWIGALAPDGDLARGSGLARGSALAPGGAGKAAGAVEPNGAGQPVGAGEPVLPPASAPPASALGASAALPALPPGGSEELSAADAALESIVLGLRMARGVPRERALAQADVFTWAAEMGLVEDGPDDRIRLTLRGRLLSNELFARLL
jgi:oxygen-independent coproporphyrinogen-3 oxidase